MKINLLLSSMAKVLLIKTNAFAMQSNPVTIHVSAKIETSAPITVQEELDFGHIFLPNNTDAQIQIAQSQTTIYTI